MPTGNTQTKRQINIHQKANTENKQQHQQLTLEHQPTSQHKETKA